MTTLAKIKPAAYAASELDIRFEVAESGEDDWPLLAQWTGTHVVVFDKEHAEHLARVSTSLANRIDTDLEDGLLGDDRKASRWAAQGLWSLADKLRKLAAS